MANPINDSFVDIELTSGTVFRSFRNHILCEGDNEANIFGVRIYKDGQPFNPTGSCVGYFIRPEQTTVVINGVIQGNVAYVSLPLSCYVYPGNFTLAIKITDGQGFTDGMRIVDGTVVQTYTGEIVDPGGVIPDLDELLAVIADAEAQADRIETLDIEAVPLEGFTDLYRIDVTFDEG